MKLVSGKSFKGQRVTLDGKLFENCQFDDCRLVIEGDNMFEMKDCTLAENCKLAIEGRGQVVLNMLKVMLHSGGWLSQVADNVLYTVKQPPKGTASKSTAA